MNIPNKDADPIGAAVDAEFGQVVDFDKAIAPDEWQTPGEYYCRMPTATRAAVSSVVASDERLRRELRETYLPEMDRSGQVRWRRADPRYIEALKDKKLYTGRVMAADGTLSRYATLSLVGAQIAISRVGYQGNTGQFVSNIMQWGEELPRQTSARDIARALRSRGAKVRDSLPNLFLYALTLYKERQILLDTPPDTFKLIQGTVFPHEMLTGAGRSRVMTTCFKIVEALIDDGDYATIVSSSTDIELLDLGLALDAGEYLITGTGTDVLNAFLYEDGSSRPKAHYSNQRIPEYGNRSQIEIFKEFMEAYGPRVVQGVLRAHRMSRPYVFFCNADRVEEAVHILLADAANTGPRGFPLLLDVADQYCGGSFKASEYTAHMNAEFARASGGSATYHAERSTRD